MGAWGPGRAVPWCLGRLPWVPGAPPGGSLGGLPGPMSAGQFRSGPIGFRIKVYVDLDVDFWSYWGRSWVPLGGHFRSFWRLGPPKLVPKPSSNRLNIEQVIFPKNERHRGREHDIEVQVGPRWHPRRPKIAQDGSKIVLDRFFCLLIFRFDLGSFWVPFWCRFGLPNAPPGVPPNWGLEGPWGSKTVLKSSWFGSLVVLSFGVAFLVVLGSF